jgi:hypothetical protein
MDLRALLLQNWLHLQERIHDILESLLLLQAPKKNELAVKHVPKILPGQKSK